MLPTPIHETLDDVVGDRNEEDRNDARGQHATKHGKAKQHTTMRSGARRHDQRKHAENECEGRHQNRTESQSRSSQGGLSNRLTLFKFHLGELYDEDGILRSQSDQHDQSDLGKDVVFARLWRHQLQQPQAPKAPNTAIGVPSSTLNGRAQLSYCAARIRNTKSSEKPKITVAGTPSAATFSWNDIPM